jgi:hypothetical protein
MSAPLNPIEAAFAVTPWWMLAIRNFDAIEVLPTVFNADQDA